MTVIIAVIAARKLSLKTLVMMHCDISSMHVAVDEINLLLRSEIFRSREIKLMFFIRNNR